MDAANGFVSDPWHWYVLVSLMFLQLVVAWMILFK